MADSAHPTVRADGDDFVLGNADESKAPNAQAPMVGPSKRKRDDGEPSQNHPDPPKRRGGRKPIVNATEMISHDEYNTKPNETKAQKSWRHQRI
jgi:hypothetical protein